MVGRRRSVNTLPRFSWKIFALPSFLGTRFSGSLTLQCILKRAYSADDRDYCDVTHTIPGSDKKLHEITVKSFSPARHITQPGFHLLSLYPERTPSHAHSPCLLPRANGSFIRLYIPAMGFTVIILIFAYMQRARRDARLRLATASPLPSHFDPSQLTSPQPAPAPLPSPYSASSAYSYSYAYSNTPPSSQQGRDRIRFDLPRSDSKLSPGGRRTFGGPRPPALRLPPLPVHDEDEHDGVRADYLCAPPASPIPGDLLARRPSARASSTGDVAVTSPSARAWSFTYTFTIRGRRRRIAVHAPAWWPQWAGTRRKGSGIWSAVGRDLGSVMVPALATWVILLWWDSA